MIDGNPISSLRLKSKFRNDDKLEALSGDTDAIWFPDKSKLRRDGSGNSGI